MYLSINPPSPTGLSLTPIAAATRAVGAVQPVEPVTAARPATAEDKPTRPVTPLSMSLHLMRVPASRLADVYNEMKSLANDSPGMRFGAAAADTVHSTAALHLRA